MPPLLAHLLALALVLTELVLRALKIRLLVPPGERPSLWSVARANAYGDAAAAVTPARLGGEPGRYFGLRQAGVSRTASVGAVATERVIDWILIAGWVLVLSVGFGGASIRGARQLVGRLGSGTPSLALGVVAAAMLLCLVALWWYRRRHPRDRAVPLRAVWAYLKGLSAARVGAAAVLTTVGMAARVAVLPVLCLGAGVEIDPAPAIVGSFALLYSQLVLPTPAGAGGVELGFALGFADVLSPGQIAVLLVQWRLYTLFVGMGIGGVLLMRTVMLRRRAVRVLGVLFVVTFGGVQVGGAQEQTGSRYLAVDHWGYEYVQRLRPRGYLENLNPLVQPYTRLEVARGLVALDPDTLPEPVRGWVRLLREELAPELGRLSGRVGRTWGVEFTAGARASTSQRLDPLRPLGDADLWPRYTLGGWLESGPFAAETRLLGDVFLEDDPDGLKPGQRRFGRADNAYLFVALPFGAVTLGRMKRNWSALGTRGLMVSDVPTAYPQIAFLVTAGRFTVRSLTGELQTIDGHKRYLAGHRIDYRSGELVLSFGESILYANPNGGLQLRFLNPFEFLFFDHNNAPNDVEQNLALSWQVWYRTGRLTMHLDALLDDMDVIPGERDPEPLLYAFTLGARLSALTPWLDAGVTYEQVAAFAYRTPNVVDNYHFLDRGLGPNYSDYDRLTLAADLYPALPGVRLTPLLQLQRQGEGDFRDSIPPMAEYLASPTIFLGTTETTLRLGLRTRYQPIRQFWVAFDAGWNIVQSARHVADDDRSEFEAAGEVGVRIDLPWR